MLLIVTGSYRNTDFNSILSQEPNSENTNPLIYTHVCSHDELLMCELLIQLEQMNS